VLTIIMNTQVTLPSMQKILQVDFVARRKNVNVLSGNRNGMTAVAAPLAFLLSRS